MSLRPFDTATQLLPFWAWSDGTWEMAWNTSETPTNYGKDPDTVAEPEIDLEFGKVTVGNMYLSLLQNPRFKTSYIDLKVTDPEKDFNSESKLFRKWYIWRWYAHNAPSYKDVYLDWVRRSNFRLPDYYSDQEDSFETFWYKSPSKPFTTIATPYQFWRIWR